MTTNLLSRPEPPAPPHLCPGNWGPSFLNHYERSEGQDPPPPSVGGVQWINEYIGGWIGGWLEMGRKERSGAHMNNEWIGRCQGRTEGR